MRCEIILIGGGCCLFSLAPSALLFDIPEPKVLHGAICFLFTSAVFTSKSDRRQPTIICYRSACICSQDALCFFIFHFSFYSKAPEKTMYIKSAIRKCSYKMYLWLLKESFQRASRLCHVTSSSRVKKSDAHPGHSLRAQQMGFECEN